MIRKLIFGVLFICSILQLHGQKKVVSIKFPQGKIDFNLNTGTYDLIFKNGFSMQNLYSEVKLDKYGELTSKEFKRHSIHKDNYSDKHGPAQQITFEHENQNGLILRNRFIYYKDKPYLLFQLEVLTKDNDELASNYLSPLSSSLSSQSNVQFNTDYPKLVDFPFDNDNWLELLALPWPNKTEKQIEGVSHEIFMLYDNLTFKGAVFGSLEHDFWKTGFQYKTDESNGKLGEFIVYSGAARSDNPDLPGNFGGLDGTHDVIPHGKMKSKVLKSALMFVDGSDDFRQSANLFAKVQADYSGMLKWDYPTPVYWNSFPVEGVLGHERVMMPKDVYKIVDKLSELDNLEKVGQTYLSIDSYDQNIYSTEVLKEIGDYARSKGQELGFYITPFSLWTWSSQIETARLLGTEVPLREVILRDNQNQPIPFKKGDWGAFPLDPTHPATKESMISQIMKAKAIGAKLIKVDFVTAGSLESREWYNTNVRSGMQAYDYGMKLFNQLVDSIMGKDVFLTLAISPMFPNQNAHARFVSTDVHSHLRNSQPGFTHYGSTASSMITASHMGWVQGVLWPYTNMDAIVMRKFQKNPDLSESEIKARLISLISLGSILGDGTDLRDSLSHERTKKYLNNERLMSLFKKPKAFIPIKLSAGLSMDQQLTFYRSDENVLLSAFNFNIQDVFEATFDLKTLGAFGKSLVVKDCFTGLEIAKIKKGDTEFKINIQPGESILLELF